MACACGATLNIHHASTHLHQRDIQRAKYAPCHLLETAHSALFCQAALEQRLTLILGFMPCDPNHSIRLLPFIEQAVYLHLEGLFIECTVVT